MKYKSREELIELSQSEWQRMWAKLDELDEAQLTRRSKAAPGKPAWSIKDGMAHVHAWYRLTLGWIATGVDGNPDLPAKGFRWNQTRELNKQLHEEFVDVSLASVRRRLKLSHGRLMKCVEAMTENELLQSGEFVWTGKLPLTSYIGPNTVGHYRWLQKKIKRL